MYVYFLKRLGNVIDMFCLRINKEFSECRGRMLNMRMVGEVRELKEG